METTKFFSVLFVMLLAISSCAKVDEEKIENVSTTLFTIKPNQWVQHGNWYGVDLVVPSIKDSINDIVITHVSKVNTPYAYQWFGLPMSSVIVTGDIMNYVYGKGHETIGYNYYSAPTTDIIIKVQVITPSN